MTRQNPSIALRSYAAHPSESAVLHIQVVACITKNDASSTLPLLIDYTLQLTSQLSLILYLGFLYDYGVLMPVG